MVFLCSNRIRRITLSLPFFYTVVYNTRRSIITLEVAERPINLLFIKKMRHKSIYGDIGIASQGCNYNTYLSIL